jgi:phage/plasmid-like protein (TIGR03299 family)
MSDAIARNVNGQDSFAYVGEAGWHGKGQQLAADATREEWLQASGMAHHLLRSKIRFATGRDQGVAEFAEWPETHVIFRSDTKRPLATVSERYQIFQPAQVFDFLHDVAEQNGLTMETAGVLFDGRRYFALAKTGHEINLAGVDLVKAYVLAATSCDGSMATEFRFTSTRVVCNNTLQIARGEKNAGAIKVRHNTTVDARDVQIKMGLLDDAWGKFEREAATLASARLTKQDAVRVLVSAIGDAEKFALDVRDAGIEKAIAEQPNSRLMGEILVKFAGAGKGSDLVTASGTAWGLINAATEYFDHDAGRLPDNRIASAWWGPNAQRKDAIVNEALALIAA